MKILFCVDVTNNRKNDIFNGSEFITASTSNNDLAAYEKNSELLKKLSRDTDIPIILKIIMILLLFSSLISILGAIINSIKMGVVEAYNFAPFSFILCLVSLFIFSSIIFLQKKKYKRVSDDPETNVILSDIEKLNSEIYTKLGVSDDAWEVDVLSFCYAVKNGKPIMMERNFQSYVNQIVRIFTTDTQLCIADISDLYCIPLDSIKNIRSEKENVLKILGWNKSEDPAEEKYKKYILDETNSGYILVQGCFILEFEHDGEAWEIWFPSYEEDTVKELLSSCGQISLS